MSSDAIAQVPASALPRLEPRTGLRLDWSTVLVLWRRDMMRLFRQRSRLFGAVGQPLIFWLVIGSGMAGSFRVPGAEDLGYMQYFFPGVISMVVLFTSIFSTMSVIEDRNQGFLQAVLTAPGSRGAVAMGKILGGTTVAIVQAALFLAMSPWAGFPPTQIDWASLTVALVGSSIGLTALGFSIAWFVNSTQGYHAIMSILLLPLWVLSGAMFPMQGSSPWLAWTMRLNPMTYSVEATRRALYGGEVPSGVGLGSTGHLLELALVLLFAVSAVVLSVALVRRRS